jgi:hypothetical protein
MNATELLRKQHREISSLFKQLEKAKQDEKKREIFEELAANLVAHDAIERELFYPACEKELGMTTELGEALVEHGLVEFSLYQADQAQDHDDFEFKCTVLEEVVEHHVEEEEKEFLPSAEKALGKRRLGELGSEMEARFDEARSEDFRAPLHENLKQVLAGAIKPTNGRSAKKPATNGRSAKKSAAKRNSKRAAASRASAR